MNTWQTKSMIYTPDFRISNNNNANLYGRERSQAIPNVQDCAQLPFGDSLLFFSRHQLLFYLIA